LVERLVGGDVLYGDDDSSFAVGLSRRHPRFRIYAEAESGGRTGSCR
jgi:hypothetical protein